MNDHQTISVSLLAVMPLICALPQSAIAQSIGPISTETASTYQTVESNIEAATNSPQTIITTQGQHTHIEGGVSVNSNLFHRFDSFNVETGNTANFVTPESTQAVIGQISGGNTSYIDGTLQVSGSEADLYLINPAGVLFGENAQLNLGGDLTATTANHIGFGDTWVDVANTQDYSQITAGPDAYKFTTPTPGSVINHADLAVEDGNAVRLIGGNVVNTGDISAPAGEITIAAVPGENLVRLDATGSLLTLEIEPPSEEIAALALPELLTGEAAHTATALQTNDDGSVSLVGSVTLTGELDVSSPVTGETGGEINILGESVEVYGADLYADGDAGGGLIRVGGNYQGKGATPTAEQVTFTGTAHADALIDGDGGEIILWADGVTDFSGELSANGAGEGKGGLIETSGQAQLILGESTQVTTDAPSGDLGTWLLDPVDLTVIAPDGNVNGSIIGGTNTPADTKIEAALIETALNFNNVTLQATNSITVDTAINASGNVAPGDLTLQAPTLNLNDTIDLRIGSSLSGTASAINLGANGRLQNAVDAIAPLGTITLASTTYTGSETFISKDITLQGQGRDNTIFDGGDVRRLFTISDGSVAIDGVGIRSGNSQTLGGGGILVTGTGSLALTDSALISNQAREGGNQYGGGIYFRGPGISTIEDSTFQYNSVSLHGGALRTDAGHQLTVRRSTFDNNVASINAGAIDRASTGGRLEIEDSTFRLNTAQLDGGAIATGLGTGAFEIERTTFDTNFAFNGNGGALKADEAPITIRDSRFEGNQSSSAGRNGGAISTTGDLTLLNSQLESNLSAGQGGALFLGGNSIGSIQQTTLDGNTAQGDGGAIALATQSQLTIDRSTLSNNSANGDGGAIYQDSASATGLTIDTSTLSGNRANGVTSNGGALAIETGTTTTLTHVTVANNTASSLGGGIESLVGSLFLTNSLITNNTATTGNDIRGDFNSGGHNLVSSRTNSFGYVPTDLPNGLNANLGALTDNGGTTFTHALLSGSPAIDATISTSGTDQRNGIANGMRDIGAYERLLDNDFIITAGAGQSTTVDTAFADAVEVKVVDALGGALDGIPVSFNQPSTSGAEVIFDSFATPVTDSNGLASVALSANTSSGEAKFRVRTPNTSRSVVSVSNVAGDPDSLTITSGEGQSATVGTDFTDTLSFQVRDRFGNIVSNARVDFSVPSTGASGTLSELFHITGRSGEGNVDVDANTIAGSFDVTASIGSLTAAISLENLADAASRFALSAHPSTVTAGDTNPFTLTAFDQFDNIASGYSGTVAFTSSDTQAQLPSLSMLTNGIGNFSSELRTAGTQSITAADTLNSSLSTTQSNITVDPGIPTAIATSLSILDGNNQQAVVNTAFDRDLTLKVSDRFGNGVSGEAITFTPLGTRANGTVGTPTGVTDVNGQLSTTLRANTVAGTYTVRADSNIPADAGTLAAIFAVENVADDAQDLHISGFLPREITAGESASFTVTARDQFYNVATGYTGTIDFSTTDDNAQIPSSTQLANGIGQFSGTPQTAGIHSLLVTDNANASLSATQNDIVVVAAAPSNLEIVSGNTQSSVVNTAFQEDLVVRLQDRFGNAVANEQISLASVGTGAGAVLSDSAVTTNANGEGRFSAIANTIAGSVILQTDFNALSAQFDLQNIAGAASQLVLSGHPTTVTAGETNTFTLTALDPFNNTADSYSGTVTFSSDDLQAQFSSPALLNNGVGSFSSELRTAGLQRLTATDTLDASLTTTQNDIVVNAAAADSVTILSGNHQNTLLNTPFAQDLTVEVRDRFGNPLVGEPISFVAPTSGAGASLSSPVVILDDFGQATTTTSANTQVGSYLVNAVIAGVSEAFSLENRSPNVTSVIETGAPSNPLDPFLENSSNGDGDGSDDLFDEYAFGQLEQSLSEEYAKYWQVPLKKGASLDSVQQILQQAEDEYQSRSAVVYAVFVPPSNAENETEYSSLLSRRLLTNDVNNAQDELLLLLIPPEGPPVQQRVDVNRRQLQRQAQLFNIELSSFFGDGYQPLARQLYSWLLAPIEEDIQSAGINDLMYVLDEGLNTVPIAAMMTDDTYAMERYGLSVLPSIGLLQTDFGEDPAAQTVLAAGSDTFTELEALPAVPIELDIVESTATSSQVLLNESFSIENLTQAQAQSPKSIMHVATHAAFNPGATDRSYIQFWEEQLKLEDIADLGLEDLELLILSACTTALGSRDAELGFAGLAAATGVEASIGSLWNVSDLGTMALMAAFYEQLQANPLRFAALRQAQLSLRNGDTRIENNRLITQSGSVPIPPSLVAQDIDFSHPFFWSSFTLVGNPWW